MLPTEPVGSIPRPSSLQRTVLDVEAGLANPALLHAEQDRAVADTLARFAETGSPLVTDGEQRRQSFASYPLGGSGADDSGDTAANVFAVFADGHHRVLPRLTSGPFRYRAWAADDLMLARAHTDLPLKQAVVSPAMLSLMYPFEGEVAGYPRAQFHDDLVDACASDIGGAFAAGASRVSIDFTEGRLALSRDARQPWAGRARLGGFIELMNRVLDRFPAEDRARIGVHTCPGSDRDSAHSAEVDYAELIPELFQIEAGYFLVQAASERDPDRVAALVGREIGRLGERAPHVRLGVTNPLTPRLETAEEVRDQLVRAARFIPPEQLGSTDDCGFSPYVIDDKPRHGSADFAREVAFAKIATRVRGTELARAELSGVAA